MIEPTIAILISVPSSVLALVGIGAVLVKIGRKDQTLEEHSRSIAEHAKVLRECQERGLVSASQCHDTQDACVQNQVMANERIIKDIASLKEDVKTNRAEVRTEVAASNQEYRKILMRMYERLGNIDGVIGKYRLPKDGGMES